VAPLAETLLERLREHPKVSRSAIAGSYRRAKETLHDLDFLVATKEPAELTKFFSDFPEVHEVIAQGDTKASVRLDNGLQCDLRAVSNDHFPFALQYFTGSKEHNVALRSLALKKGLSLNEYDFTGEGEIPKVEEEIDIYQALGPRLDRTRAQRKSRVKLKLRATQISQTLSNSANSGEHFITTLLLPTEKTLLRRWPLPRKTMAFNI
jgi:DNA polymerase/3'-5' exonuclease PolX